MRKKEGLIVLIIVALISMGGYYVSKNAVKVKTVFPPGKPILNDSDFAVKITGGDLVIGQTDLTEAKKLLPDGKDLGMSTVYRSNSPECILTFNKKQTQLKQLHLLSDDLVTSRGIKVGDPFSKVVAAYGKNYIFTGKALNAADFEAIYQRDNHHSVIFKVKNNKVFTIVLHEDTRPRPGT
ncbi:MAG: hypothetical protein GXY34_06950 [Syntrophomonadaceae bacterium]|nr:hypothetical protein [Syntrophomonadaceae bacterium]